MPELKTAFIANMRALLGEEAGAFFRALEEAPSLALRPHRGMEAASPFIEGAVPWAEGGFYLRPGARPGASVAHWAGAFYLQEASAMLPAAALKARPGERVLDLCAAPGGKSSQIALAMGGEGALVANEVDAARARVLAANLERLGVTNAVVLNETPARLAARWPEYFDAVLVDAPCSGEGMFRRDPQSREAWTDAAPRGCRKRQGEILDAAAKLVRPGGRLLYSTCTFNGEENEGSVADFLRAHADFFPEEFALPGLGASQGGMLRIWPHRARGDGQFAALLRRAGEDGGDGPETWAGAADAAGRPHARGDGPERALAGADAVAGEVSTRGNGADEDAGRAFARGDGEERTRDGADAAAGEVFMRADGAGEDAGRAFARGDGEERARDGADAAAGEVFMRRDGADGSGELSSAHPAASIDRWLDALPKARPARRAGKAAPMPDVAALLAELGKCAVAALPVSPRSARLHLEGRRLIAAPLEAPELDGLRVISPGLALLRAETGRVEPEHALSMALLPGMARREAALTEKEALAFIAGEALPREGEAGWALVTHAGLPLGWGKQAGGMLKNHVPKGLRARLHP